MDRQETEALLKQFGIQPTHSLGQNFLVDPLVAGRILSACALTPDNQVIEIGPGLGAMTRLAAQTAGRVAAIEIDRHLIPVLKQVLAAFPHCRVIHQDALKTDIGSLADGWSGETIVLGNLPYYITTALIEHVLCDLPMARRCVFMLQKEAADRLLRGPGTKSYRPTTILLALHGSSRCLFQVSPEAFWPRPHIASTVILIEKAGHAADCPDSRLDGCFTSDRQTRWLFLRFLERCFRQRRKKLSHNLPCGMGLSPASLLEQAGLEAAVRAEQVQPRQFYDLFMRLHQLDPSGRWIDA